MTETNATATKDEAFRLTNALIELSKILSERLWADDSIKDQCALAAMADSIHAAADEIHDLAQTM